MPIGPGPMECVYLDFLLPCHVIFISESVLMSYFCSYPSGKTSKIKFFRRDSGSKLLTTYFQFWATVSEALDGIGTE
jgi:hypothetical protein